jgi:hypothetical protein
LSCDSKLDYIYTDYLEGSKQMGKGREIMTDWVVDALGQLGGSGTIIEVARRVWDRHEPDIRAAEDLLYEWQYELRWAGDILRRDGILRPSDNSKRGVWELS